MQKKFMLILSACLLIIGVSVLVYPAVSGYINKKHGSYAIIEFHQKIDNTDQKMLDDQRRLAEAYNRTIWDGVPCGDYDSILNFENGMMGYISIPEIDVNLPIYHGVDEAVLTKGIGHLPDSSFPIGGEGNHSVLTGHTGLPSAKLFTNLSKLKEGDIFEINILKETLSYCVDQIKVVLPNETNDLRTVEGRDYCTLVTCTPYGVNSHRLLVRGARIENKTVEPISNPNQLVSVQTFLVMLSAMLALLLSLCVVILQIIRRKRYHR